MDRFEKYANLFASSIEMHGNDFEPFAKTFIHLLRIEPIYDRLQMNNIFPLIEAMFRLRHASSQQLTRLLSVRDEILSRLPKTEPSHLIREENGCLVIDARAAYPQLEEARHAVERYLFKRAVAECGGNVSEACRRLGISRNVGHALSKIMQGLPIRASRASGDNKAKPKRRRSRS
jgi:hypothetical protein